MKLNKLAAMAAAIAGLAIGLLWPPMQAVEANLSCNDLTKCSGAACDGPGTPTGCLLACDSGAVVACNES